MDKYLVICMKHVTESFERIKCLYASFRDILDFYGKPLGWMTIARRFLRISRSNCGLNNNWVRHKLSGSLFAFPITCECITHALVSIVINSTPLRNDDNGHNSKQTRPHISEKFHSTRSTLHTSFRVDLLIFGESFIPDSNVSRFQNSWDGRDENEIRRRQ